MKIRIALVLLLALPGSLVAQQSWDTISYGPEGYHAALARFKAEPVQKGIVIFLGNSITEGGNWKKLLKDSTVMNRGISGDITFGVMYRLEEITRRQPSKVFLLIGINDISKDIPDAVVMENIISIARRIKSASPKTTVFVQSILPTNNAFPDFPKHKNKDEHVITINEQLKKYSGKLGYTYVDLYSHFVDGEKRLPSKFTNDGLHLNLAGYQEWVSILKSLNYL